MTVFFDCPAPKRCAAAVLKDSAVSEQLLGWYEQHQAHITDLFNQQVGDPAGFQALLEETDIQLNAESMTFIFSAGILILSFLENMAGVTMKRHDLAFIRKLLTRVTFSTAPKRTKNRRSAREFETARASGQHDMSAKSRKRNCRVQQQVRPRQRRRTDDAYEPLPVDPIEYSFCAIDPNHKNLCKYSIGSNIDNNNVDHQLSGLALNSKAKKIILDTCITKLLFRTEFPQMSV
ncbi:hypothetical protein P9112_004639 [Eukaryota sp. TZLM1-RC]